MKIKPLVELFVAVDMLQYAEVCDFTLARAHARSGEPALISGYLGQSDSFDRAIAAFSAAYADQSEKDHAVLMKAVRSGDLEVVNRSRKPKKAAKKKSGDAEEGPARKKQKKSDD